MNKLVVFIFITIAALGMIGTTTIIGILDSYATKTPQKQSQQPSETTTVQRERQSQQPSSPGASTLQPQRQSQQPPENPDSQRLEQAGSELFNPADQQEDENNGDNAAIEQKDEQILDVLQEENDEINGDNEEQIEQIEIDKKAPIAISGDNVYIVWLNDQNTPNNNSEVIFRSSADAGTTFTDKINLSNTTAADSINADIAADGDNVVITWWERNSTSQDPMVRASTDNGATFGPVLRLTTNGTIGETAE
jgi:hypothetical protein